MRSNENEKNRGTHGDSLRMLGGLPSSNKNPPASAVGSVKGMLEMLNSLCGTKYAFLAKRVIRFENPEIGYHSPCHDLHAELWYKVDFRKEGKGE